MGNSIVKIIKLVEFIKRTVADVHCAYEIGSIAFEETYQPLYEGLVEVKTVANKAAMFARFSFNSKDLVGQPGYQVV